jgi:hypothetical protein
MADDDQSIWDSVDEPATETVEAPQVESATEQVETPRDERGRFAPKTAAEQATEQAAQEQPEAPATEQPNRGSIPPYRLKEEADARRAAEERAANNERMLAEMQRQLQALQKQNEPQQPVPDLYENPDAFVDYRNKQAIEPIKSEISQLREYYSRRDAIREHGAEKVDAAYEALGRGLSSRDPEAIAVYQRATQSLDPFGDIMQWHRKQTIFSTIGDDPESFVERQIEERLKDPTYQAKLLERIRGVAQGRPSTVTPLPPSLNRATSAAAIDGEEDESDAGLLNAALRR